MMKYAVIADFTRLMRLSLQLPLFLLFLLFSLVACTSKFKYQEEPSVYKAVKTPLATSYIALAFPQGSSQHLALQLALVKHKSQAADKERWLLLHNITYRWLWVKWQGGYWHLLAVGPYKKGRQLSAQRRVLEHSIDGLSSMPAIVWYGLPDSKLFSGETMAERDQKAKQEGLAMP